MSLKHNRNCCSLRSMFLLLWFSFSGKLKIWWDAGQKHVTDLRSSAFIHVLLTCFLYEKDDTGCWGLRTCEVLIGSVTLTFKAQAPPGWLLASWKPRCVGVSVSAVKRFVPFSFVCMLVDHNLIRTTKEDYGRLCPPPSDNRPVCESGLQVWFSSEETGVCGVTLTLMLWLVGQRAFDDMLNERSEGAAQRGEGGDLPHQTATPISPLCSPLSLHSLPLWTQKGCERRPAHQLRSESCFNTDSVTVREETRSHFYQE